LILDTKVPMVLIGLPEAETVFQFNPQLSRRFANRHNLSPFEWSADAGKEFRTFLHAVESQLPLLESSDLASEEMALRFYYASDGIVAYVMKLVRYGTHLALKQGQEKLDLNVLAIAFDKYVKADKPTKHNPFLTDEFLGDSQENLTFFKPTQVGATSSRIKSKKKTKKVSDVLHK
jgi:hypothetical protein